MGSQAQSASTEGCVVEDSRVQLDELDRKLKMDAVSKVRTVPSSQNGHKHGSDAFPFHSGLREVQPSQRQRANQTAASCVIPGPRKELAEPSRPGASLLEAAAYVWNSLLGSGSESPEEANSTHRGGRA